MRINKALAFLALLLFNGRAISQNLKFESFSSKQGLLSDEVFNLHQDKKGYLWLFTNYGTMKYNSLEFKPVLQNLPFNESFIYCIYENEKGEKWVANSNANIYKIRNDSAIQVLGIDSMSAKMRRYVSEIFQLYVDDSSNIFVASKQYCYKLINQNGKYRPLNISNLHRRDTIEFWVYEKENSLLPVSNFAEFGIFNYWLNLDYLNIRITTKDRTRAYKIKGKSYAGPKLFKKFGDDIYFSYYDKVVKIDKDDNITYIPLNTVMLNFTVDRNKHLWVTTFNGGVYHLDEKYNTVSHYFKHTTVNDILFDSQNGLWLSTTGLGLQHCRDLSELQFSDDDKRSLPVSMIKKVDQELFVANNKGAIWRIKNNNWESIDKGDINLEPLDLLKCEDDYLMASKYKLQLIQGNAPYKVKLSRHVGNPCKLLYKKHDTILYMHRKGFGLLTKNPQTGLLLTNMKTFCSIQTDKGVYLGAENGIYFLPIDSVKRWAHVVFQTPRLIIDLELQEHDFLKAARGSVITNCVEDGKGNIWFCAIGSGLFQLTDKHELKFYSSEKGLPNNIIHNISFSDNNVLLSTHEGLYFTTITTEGTLGEDWRKLYSGEVQQAMFFEKKIYVGTKSGLAVLGVEKTQYNKQLSFNLAEISINGKTKPNTDLALLNYNQNDLTFRFDLISFTGDRYKLQYLLKGTVNDSGLVNEPQVKLINLPPGNYTLVAKPFTEAKNSQRIHILFKIVPAFWQTLWFIILSISALIFLAAFIVWLIFRRMKRKKDQRNEAERLILEYKLIALKAQINPHFMSNCLTAIQHLIINNKVEAATFYVAKFGLLVRQILNFSTRSLISLKEELEIANLYIELEQLRFENKFIFDLKMDKSISPKEIFVPALILNPLLENAIWHGLLPLKDTRNGKIIVEIKDGNDHVELIVEDNGVGRKVAGVNRLGNIRESKGLQLTQQRLSNINFLYRNTDSIIKYEDLVDENGHAMGTRAVISLPLNLKPIKNE
jgi:ligand-binding sensor domain-containing protein